MGLRTCASGCLALANLDMRRAQNQPRKEHQLYNAGAARAGWLPAAARCPGAIPEFLIVPGTLDKLAAVISWSIAAMMGPQNWAALEGWCRDGKESCIVASACLWYDVSR